MSCRCAESGENLGGNPAHEPAAQTSHMLDGRLVNGLVPMPRQSSQFVKATAMVNCVALTMHNRPIPLIFSSLKGLVDCS